MNNKIHFFNEFEEPYRDLMQLEKSLLQIKDNFYNIKWSIILLHSSLQGFMKLTVKGTSDLQVIKETRENKNYDAYEKLRDPDKKLDNFLGLYNKIKSNKFMKQYHASKHFKSSVDIDNSIEFLNECRNNLIHFLASSYGIEKLGIIKSMKDTLLVIRFIVNESGNLDNRYDETQKNKINNILDEVTVILNNINSEMLYNSIVNPIE